MTSTRPPAKSATKPATKFFIAVAAIFFFSIGSITGQNLPTSPTLALFRGRVAPVYTIRFNGTPYWDNGGFRQGSVFFDGRLYQGVTLNIDCQCQMLVVKQGVNEILPARELVGWFTRDDKLYINLKYYGIEELGEGFFEQYTDRGGERWYRQVRKTYSTGVDNYNGKDGIGYDDPNYKIKCLSYFKIDDRYYCWNPKKGSYDKTTERKALKAGITPDLTIPADNKAYAAPRQFGKIAGAPVGNAQGATQAQAASPTLRETLPPGYFDSGESESLKKLRENLEQSITIAESRNKTYVIGEPGAQRATTHANAATPTPQRATLSGTIRDIATGETLQGTLVSNESGSIFVYSDKDGKYEIKLPTGEHKIKASQYGKEDMTVHIILSGDGALDIMMQDEIKELQSAYVSAETRQEHRRTAMGVEKITAGVINKIPSAFGTGDVIKAILTIPGVKSTGEAGGGINVRGGSADQNLILLNDGTIFNPSHMFGVMSSFNPDIIESADLYKSSIPARYGGRISSVLDIKTKEGGQDRVRGSLGIGILTSTAEIDGPLCKSGKTTFVVGGRTTYSDWILKAMPKTSGYAGGTAGFYDVNASITQRFDENNKLQVFGYYSRDRFSFSADTTFRYNNLNASLRYTHKGKKGGTMVLSAGYDQYGNELIDGVKNARTDAYTLKTGIQQAYARLGFTLPLGQHSISYGADATMYLLSPGVLSPGGENSTLTAASLEREKGVEPAIYASDDWKIGSGPFSVEYGVRLSSFASGGKFYVGPEARVGGKYSPTPNLSFKAGFNNLNQYIHLISNTAGISPMDSWRLSSEKIKPQRGWQAAAGAYWTVASGKVDLSLEGYYKQMKNYLDYKSGAQLQMNPNLADDLVSTHAKAYGVELMAKKTTGKLTGWVAYTYSRTLLQEDPGRGAAAINGGDWYPAAHDKPHDVKLVCNYAFTHRYSISANLDYATGRPVTVPVGQYYYNGALRLAYSERNGHRIPDYFRLDLALNIEPGHYLKAFTHASATIGCYNVTGRKNAYSVYYTTNGGTKLQGYMVSVFATQIPYVTINLKF